MRRGRRSAAARKPDGAPLSPRGLRRIERCGGAKENEEADGSGDHGYGRERPESREEARGERAREVTERRAREDGERTIEEPLREGNARGREDDERERVERCLSYRAEEEDREDEGEEEDGARDGALEGSASGYFRARIMMCHPSGLRMASGRISKNGTSR